MVLPHDSSSYEVVIVYIVEVVIHFKFFKFLKLLKTRTAVKKVMTSILETMAMAAVVR